MPDLTPVTGPARSTAPSPEDEASPASLPAPTPDLGGALDAIDALRDPPPSHPELTLEVLAASLVAAYLEGGRSEVGAHLAAHPDEVAALAHLCEEPLEGALDRALVLGTPRFHSLLPLSMRRDGIVGVVKDFLEAAVRSRIFLQGTSMHRELCAQMDELEAALPQRLQELRSAPAGSPLAQLALALDVRGDDGDLARARAALATQRAAADAFVSQLASSQLWEPTELPRAASRAATSLGFGDASPASLGGALIHGTPLVVAPPTMARDAYLRSARQALNLLGVGTEVSNPLLLATSLTLAHFDRLNAERHASFLSYGSSLGL